MADHTGSTGSRGFPAALPAAAVFLAAFLTYAVTLSYGYAWDDPPLVARVQESLSSGQVSQLFTTSFYVKTVQSAHYFRPVMMGSLLADVLISGGAPWFSHLINVLLHGVNAVLVFYLLNLLLAHTPGALWGALLFAVHPVHTEAVAAVSSRMDLLALLFIFPAVFLWVSTTGHRPGRSRVLWMTASLSFLLACFSKETAFMLPIVLVGWEVFTRRRPDREKVIGTAFLLLAAGGALLARAAVFTREARDGIQTVKAGALLPEATPLTSLKILLVNMHLPAHPFPGRSQWMAGSLSVGTAVLLGGAAFILLTGLALAKNPGPAAKGFLWWAVFTLPVLGLFNLGPTMAAQRYAYIPSVGFCLVIAALIASIRIKAPGRKAAGAAGLSLVLLLGTWAAAHSLPWKKESSLFRYVARTNPGYPNIYLNLGVALMSEGKYGEAMETYDLALELFPGWTDALFNRGNLNHKMGKHEEALRDYDKVLEKEPGDWEVSLNRGNVLLALGKDEEAARSYRHAHQANGSSGKPLVGLGVLAAGEGDYQRAVTLFQEAASREPLLAEAFEGLGEAYAILGMNGMAETAYMKALKISPDNTRAAIKLGRFLLGTGRPAQASHAFRAALAADPELQQAWEGLVISLDAAGQESQADRTIRDLKTRDPALAERITELRRKGPIPYGQRQEGPRQGQAINPESMFRSRGPGGER